MFGGVLKRSTGDARGCSERASPVDRFNTPPNMANVLALFGNMFAFKGSFQAEVRARPPRVSGDSRESHARSGVRERSSRDGDVVGARARVAAATHRARSDPALWHRDHQ